MRYPLTQCYILPVFLGIPTTSLEILLEMGRFQDLVARSQDWENRDETTARMLKVGRTIQRLFGGNERCKLVARALSSRVQLNVIAILRTIPIRNVKHDQAYIDKWPKLPDHHQLL